MPNEDKVGHTRLLTSSILFTSYTPSDAQDKQLILPSFKICLVESIRGEIIFEQESHTFAL